MKIAYARVSTLDQNLDRQIEVFEKFGAEKLSGKMCLRELCFKKL